MKQITVIIAYNFLLFVWFSPQIYSAQEKNIKYHIHGMILLNAVAQGNTTEVENALKNKSYINYQAEGTRNSALHIAALFNHNQAAMQTILIHHKIDQTLRECTGKTADELDAFLKKKFTST